MGSSISTAEPVTQSLPRSLSSAHSGAAKRRRRNERVNTLLRRLCALIAACASFLFKHTNAVVDGFDTGFCSSSSSSSYSSFIEDVPLSRTTTALLIGALVVISSVSMAGAAPVRIRSMDDSGGGGLWLLSDNAVRFSYMLCRTSEPCRRAYYLSEASSGGGGSSSSSRDEATAVIDYDWELFQHLYGIFARQHVGMPVCPVLQRFFDGSAAELAAAGTAAEELQLWHELLISTPFCGTNEAFVIGAGCRCREGAQCEHSHVYGSRMAAASASKPENKVDGRFFILRGDITSVHLLLLLAMALVAYLSYRLWSSAVQNEASQERLFALFRSTVEYLNSRAPLDSPVIHATAAAAPPVANMGVSY